MLNPDALRQRKALLVMQAELDRVRLAAAAHELRTELLPPRLPGSSAGTSLLAARLVGIAVPLLGANSSLRVVRMLSLAVTAYRIIGGLLGRRGRP